MNEGTSALKQEAQLTVLESPKTLYKKLAEVMKQVSRVPKNGFNSHFKYNFATESDIKDVIRPLLAEQNIALVVDMVSLNQDGKRTLVEMEFTFACGDTGATISKRFWGEALDAQDKGINKATTAAEKYFLINFFMISTGEDPDAGGDAPETTKNGGKAAPQVSSYTKGAQNANKGTQGATAGASSSVFGKAKDAEEAVAAALKFQQDKEKHPHWLIDGEFIAKCKGYWPKVTDGQIDMAVMAVQDPEKVENKVLMAAAVFASAMNGDKDAILAYAATQENQEFWTELAQTAIEVAPRVVNF